MAASDHDRIARQHTFNFSNGVLKHPEIILESRKAR